MHITLFSRKHKPHNFQKKHHKPHSLDHILRFPKKPHLCWTDAIANRPLRIERPEAKRPGLFSPDTAASARARRRATLSARTHERSGQCPVGEWAASVVVPCPAGRRCGDVRVPAPPDRMEPFGARTAVRLCAGGRLVSHQITGRCQLIKSCCSLVRALGPAG